MITEIDDVKLKVNLIAYQCGICYDLQVKSLKRTFDQFDSDKSGAISVGTVNTILKMMGMHVSTVALEVSNVEIAFFIY